MSITTKPEEMQPVGGEAGGDAVSGGEARGDATTT